MAATARVISRCFSSAILSIRASPSSTSMALIMSACASGFCVALIMAPGLEPEPGPPSKMDPAIPRGAPSAASPLALARPSTGARFSACTFAYTALLRLCVSCVKSFLFLPDLSRSSLARCRRDREGPADSSRPSSSSICLCALRISLSTSSVAMRMFDRCLRPSTPASPTPAPSSSARRRRGRAATTRRSAPPPPSSCGGGVAARRPARVRAPVGASHLCRAPRGVRCAPSRSPASRTPPRTSPSSRRSRCSSWRRPASPAPRTARCRAAWTSAAAYPSSMPSARAAARRSVGQRDTGPTRIARGPGRNATSSLKRLEGDGPSMPGLAARAQHIDEWASTTVRMAMRWITTTMRRSWR